jgi:hypothetical protein
MADDISMLPKLAPWELLLVWSLSACALTPSTSLPPTPGSRDLSAISPGLKPSVNLDANLSQLLADWSASPDQAAAQAESQGLVIEGDRVMVTIVLADEAQGESIREAIGELGGVVVNYFKTLVDAKVPIARLGDVAALPGVGLVRQPTPSLPLAP